MSDAATKAGKKMLCGDYSQYTPTGKSYFVRAGRYDKLPQVGDVVYFYHKSQGRVAHTGAVISVEEVDYYHRRFSFTTVEGNTSPKEWERNGGMVAVKTYKDIPMESVGTGKENHIDGFGHPVFSADTCSVADFVAALKGEIGYIEKASASGIGATDRTATPEEKAANRGTGNYTKYGAWYGMNGVAWCQQFVSWCAYLACRTAAASGWHKDDGVHWRYRSGGVDVAGRWAQIEGRWYVFDNAGNMIVKWFQDSTGDWYYLNEDGAMLSDQWVFYKGEWYYLTGSGVTLTNGYIFDEAHGAYCYVDDTGKWDGRYVVSPGPGVEVG